MKKLKWLVMVFALFISGCASTGNVVKDRGFGWLYEGVISNPTQCTLVISNSSWKKDITIPPESGKVILLPKGRVYFIVTYYEDGEAVGKWEDWEYINPIRKQYFFEDEFFWWQKVIGDFASRNQEKNLLKK